ncbi:unnamed protein product [Caenorhabditis brenneri]
MEIVSTSSSFRFCEVCGKKAHGNHFGVVSCRACAVFFRRTITTKYSKMKCQEGQCDREKFFCKPCRLQECKKAGMNTTKFQYNRDDITGQFQLPSPSPSSFNSFIGRPDFLLFCDTDAPNTKILVDVRYLLEEATRILSHGASTPVCGTTQLKKFTQGFKYIQLDMNNLRPQEKADQEEIMGKWEYYFLTVTKWLMYFDGFQKLNRHLQMTLLQSIWHVFEKLHQYVRTMSYRKINPNAKTTHMVVRDFVMDIEKIEFDFSWLSDYSTRDVMSYLSTQNCCNFDIVEALQELDASDVELTYLFAQLCFEYAGKRYQGEILKVTESFQAILANDLHHYYVDDMNKPRYGLRLAKLMKINNAIQRAIWESRPKIELGKVFNVMKIEFSHPEMFEDSGYS